MADGKVVIEASLDSKGFEKGVKGLSNKAKSGIGGFAKGAIGAGVSFEVLRRTAGKFISDMDKTNAAWKTFGDNMKAAGHSTKEINAAKKDMQDFSAKSIYYSSEMAATYAQLDAVGIKSTGSIVKGFGAVAAAAENPRQAMKTVSQQATQMAAKPHVAWMDFKLMLEQTPAGISQIAKVMGKSTSQLVAEVQAGKVKTQDFFNAIAKIGGNPQHKLMKMATTYKTIGEAANGVTGTLMTRLAPAYNVVAKAAIKGLTKMMGGIAKIDANALADKVESGVKKAIPIVKGLVNVLSVLAKTGVTVATPLFKIAGGALKIAGSMPNATAAAITMVGAFKGFQKLQPGFSAVKTFIAGVGDMSRLAAAGYTGLTSQMGKTGMAVSKLQSGLDLLSNKLKLAKPLTLGAVAPLGLLAGGLAVCGAAIYRNVKAYSKWTDEVSHSKQVANKRVMAAKGEIATIDFYKNQLDNLAGKESKTAADKQRMIHLVGELNKLVPGLSLKYNAQTDNLNQTTNAINKKIEARKREIQTEAYAKNLKDAYEQKAKHEKDKQFLEDDKAKYKKAMDDAAASGGATLQNDAYAKAKKNLEITEKKLKDVDKSLKTNAKDIQYCEDKFNAASGNINKIMSSTKRYARKAGIGIPKAVATGIKAGKIDVTTAEKEIDAAIKFEGLVSKAKKAGIKVPKKLQNGISSGKMLPSQAVKKMNGLIKNQESKASSNSHSQGKKVSTGMASGIRSASGSAKSAAQSMVSGVFNAGSGTYGSGHTSGSNYGAGFASGISGWIQSVAGVARSLVKNAIKAGKKAQHEKSPSRVMIRSGKHFGQGYAIGISSTRKRVNKSARRLVRGAIRSAKPSKSYKIGKRFAGGIATGIKNGYRGVKKATSSLISNTIKKAKKTKSSFSAVGDYFTKGFSKVLSSQKSSATKAFSKYTGSLVKKTKGKKAKKNMRDAAKVLRKTFSDALSEENKKLNKKAEKEVKKLSESYQRKYEELVEKRKAMRENLASPGELFTKTDGSVSGLRDVGANNISGALSKNIRDLKRYQDNLKSVKSKIPDDLMKEILGMGVPEANKYMRRLLRLSEAQRQEYIDKWKSQQSQVKSIEDNYYKSVQLTSMQDQVSALKRYDKAITELKKRGASKSLLEEITTMGVDDANAYMDKLLGLTKTGLKEYVKLWEQKRSLANSISKKFYADQFKALEKGFASAISKAMKSMKTALNKYGQNLIKTFVAKTNKKKVSKSVKGIVRGAAKAVKKDKKLKKAVTPKKPTKKKTKKKTTKKKTTKKTTKKKSSSKKKSTSKKTTKKKTTSKKKSTKKKTAKKTTKKATKKTVKKSTAKKKVAVKKPAVKKSSLADRVKQAKVDTGKIYAKAQALALKDISKTTASAKVNQSRVSAAVENPKSDALVVHVHSELEGKEIARSTARFTDVELANAQKLKERGV